MKAMILLATSGLLFITGCNCPDKKHDQIRNRNIEIIELYVEEVWNKWNLDLVDSIIGDDFVDPASTTGEKGPEAFKEIITNYQTKYPDMEVTIDELVADGHKVAWKWTATGTHASTNQRTIFSGIIIDRFEDGKIVQRLAAYD